MATKTKYARVTVRRFRIADLEDAPYNPRTATQRALAGLGKSLETFGLLALPVVNVAAGRQRLVGGHQRVKVLKAQGEKFVRGVAVTFDAAAERKANLTLNNEAIEGQFVPEMTKALLDQIRVALPKDRDLFRGLNFDTLVRQINRGLASTVTAAPVAPTHVPGSKGKATPARPVVHPDEDMQPSLPSRTEADSQVGAFYCLGRHVLHCGPSTRKGNLQGFAVDHADLGLMEIAGTSAPSAGYFTDHVGRLLTDTEGAVFVVTTVEFLPHVQRAFVRLGGHWSSTVLWLDPYGLPIAEQVYANALIPAVYGWREGSPHVFFGDKAQGNVLNLKRHVARPRMPVELAVSAMTLASEAKACVFDPDAGHGTTVIAAEKAGRRLVGYVRTARECDRVRKRWVEYVHGQGAKWRALTPKQD